MPISNGRSVRPLCSFFVVPKAQQYIERQARKYGKGKALSILAHRIGRTVYAMLTQGRPFNETQFMSRL